jgi:hypothetical protein
MPHPRTSLYFQDREWLSMNMLQSSHYLTPAADIFPWLRCNYSVIGPRSYEHIRAEYDSTPTRPVIDGEPRYEGMPVDIEYDPGKGSWCAYDTRNAAYQALFAGAAGHTFGNTSVHLSYDPLRFPVLGELGRVEEAYPDVGGSWREQLHSPGAEQMRHVKALMLSRPYFSRIPDQTLIVGETGEGTAHVGATRDKSGSYAMVYLPHGAPVTIDMTKLGGVRCVAWWFDPRSGGSERIDGTFAATGRATFTPPSSGAQSDWVLVLDDERSNHPAPGAT